MRVYDVLKGMLDRINQNTGRIKVNERNIGDDTPWKDDQSYEYNYAEKGPIEYRLSQLENLLSGLGDTSGIVFWNKDQKIFEVKPAESSSLTDSSTLARLINGVVPTNYGGTGMSLNGNFSDNGVFFSNPGDKTESAKISIDAGKIGTVTVDFKTIGYKTEDWKLIALLRIYPNNNVSNVALHAFNCDPSTNTVHAKFKNITSKKITGFYCTAQAVFIRKHAEPEGGADITVDDDITPTQL